MKTFVLQLPLFYLTEIATQGGLAKPSCYRVVSQIGISEKQRVFKFSLV